MTQDNNIEAKTPLRVVGGTEAEPQDATSETTREILGRLRDAIEHVQSRECHGIMMSIVNADKSITNIYSAFDQRHIMVAAAVYQLLDIATPAQLVETE